VGFTGYAATLHQALHFKIAQSLSEHLGTQARDQFSQFAVPVRTLLQSRQYDRLPFSSQELKRQLDRTAKAFGKPLHAILLGSDKQACACADTYFETKT
jgi:hypothetical protein